MKSGVDIVLPASLAGGAAILSIFTGFISGVSLGVIFLRGIVTALVALGFVLAVGWIIKKFLPELSDLSSEQKVDGKDGGAEPQTGNHVNIVMPAESPAGDYNSLKSPGEVKAAPPGGDRISDLDSPGSEIAEKQENGHNNKPDESDTEAVVSSRGINLDILPSLDTLELNGESASTVEELESIDDESVQVSKKEANIGGSNHDPAEIAKAVKTVLKRDQQE